MRLNHIDIVGFKSFADKVVFSLSGGITAIVGPNGSGKSNVADAVRWVLGEQSARALRGTKMEDVIFNGTTSRKPVSLCEVTLLFDNEDGVLPLPASELAVTRKLYRNGDSEYLINGQVVRMRDIQALFYDTGVGREGYSIIGQGRLEEILSAKGEERREALEEAAGVMKYKIRREEAGRKLNAVANDIIRIEDILAELGQSLEPLREQKEKAEQALACRQKLKALEINLFLHQYDRNRAHVHSLAADKQTAERAQNEHRKGLASNQQNLEALNQKMQLVEDLLNRARDKSMEFTAMLQRAQGQQALTKQRLDFLCQEQIRFNEQIESLQAQKKNLEHRLLQTDILSESQLQTIEYTLDQSSQRLESLNGALHTLERRLDEQTQALLQCVDGDAQRKALLARTETLRAQAEERKKDIDTRCMEVHAQRLQIEREITQANAHAEKSRQEEQEAIHAQKLLELEQKQALVHWDQARQALDSAKNECRQRENALQTQAQLLRDFEGYNNSVKNLMRDAQHQRMDISGMWGTVAGLLKVPEQFETAIEQVLGGSLQNLVVDTQQTAKRLIEYLRKNQYGRITFLPQQSLRVHQFSQSERVQLSGPGILGIAAELIGFDEAVQRSVQYLLGRTVIVNGIDDGINLTNKCSFSFRCVTLKGDILQSGGAMTGGSVREFNLVSRERMVKEAQEALSIAVAAQNQAALHEKMMKETAEGLQSVYEQKRILLYEKQGDVRQAVEQLNAAGLLLQRIQSSWEQLDLEAQRIHAMHEDAQRQIDQIDQTKPRDEHLIRLSIESDTVRLISLRAERELLTDEVAQLRADIAVKRSEKKSYNEQQILIQQELARIEQSLADTMMKMDENARVQQAAKEELSGMQNDWQKAVEADEENRLAQSAVQSQYEALCQQRIKVTEAIESQRTLLAEQREKNFRLETQLERLASDFEYMQARLWENHELTYTQALSYKEDMNLQNAVRDAQTLREQLHAMGTVNEGAVDEYHRVEERFVYLSTQKEDLARAREDLDHLIRELTVQMQHQFLRQFEIINVHFDRIFKNLFGGGRAELILSDPRHAMECAIDIIAQPPGKNLQLITLLSGGERALIAIALLFALLEVHATPFCILDEIESALDEENLRLFADFLKTYAKDTQFVIITHRRPTMEAAAYMYGIAMEEAGVSKTVSVKFA